MSRLRTVLSENFFRRFSRAFAPHIASIGVDKRVLVQADIEIPGEQYVALWESAAQSNHNIGIELGGLIEANDFGALGHALACAPNVEAALRTLNRFIVVFAQGAEFSVEISARNAIVEYRITTPIAQHHRQDAEFAITCVFRMLNVLTGCNIHPTRVDFKHARPADTSAHKRTFQCPIYFNQPGNRIYLPIETLRLTAEQSNERLYKALEPYLEQQRRERIESDELLLQVTRIIAAGMSSRTPSLMEVCQQLSLSRRTLQRRLKEHGLEYSVLVEGIRRELAMAYIKDSGYSMTEISLLVGYAESGSFTRAFRRWTGQSPHQYRATKLLHS